MNAKLLFVVVPATFLILGDGAAVAGQTIDKVGVIACVTDKWTETELEKGHKLADSVQRCVLIPNDPAAEKGTQACVGKYEYMPDGSWKGSGTCTDTYKGSDKIFEAWEEGSRAQGIHRSNLQVEPANTKARAAAARISTKA